MYTSGETSAHYNMSKSNSADITHVETVETMLVTMVHGYSQNTVEMGH